MASLTNSWPDDTIYRLTSAVVAKSVLLRNCSHTIMARIVHSVVVTTDDLFAMAAWNRNGILSAVRDPLRELASAFIAFAVRNASFALREIQAVQKTVPAKTHVATQAFLEPGAEGVLLGGFVEPALAAPTFFRQLLRPMLPAAFRVLLLLLLAAVLLRLVLRLVLAVKLHGAHPTENVRHETEKNRKYLHDQWWDSRLT